VYIFPCTQQSESFSLLHSPGGGFCPLILPLGRHYWASEHKKFVQIRMSNRTKDAIDAETFILYMFSLFYVVLQCAWRKGWHLDGDL